MSATAYVEHVAIWVKDIHWHIRFFREVLGMEMREVDGPIDNPRQFWTEGGVQLIADPEHTGPEGRLAHLGIMVEDQADALAKAAAFGVCELPQGPGWVALPDGLELELIQAAPGTVAATLAIDARAMGDSQ